MLKSVRKETKARFKVIGKKKTKKQKQLANKRL